MVSEDRLGIEEKVSSAHHGGSDCGSTQCSLFQSAPALSSKPRSSPQKVAQETCPVLSALRRRRTVLLLTPKACAASRRRLRRLGLEAYVASIDPPETRAGQRPRST